MSNVEALGFYRDTALNFFGDKLKSMSDVELAVWVARKNLSVASEDIVVLVSMIREAQNEVG